LALQRNGMNVQVHERDAHFHERRQGYGLTLSTTNTALKDLGIIDECRRLDVPSRCHYVFSGSGDVLGYFGNAFRTSDWKMSLRGNLRVPRQRLRQLLLDRLKPGTVHWSSKVTGFSKGSASSGGDVLPETITVETTSGSVPASILIAADGIKSPLRTALRNGHTSDALKYIGCVIVVGITDFQHPLVDQVGCSWFIPRPHIRLRTHTHFDIGSLVPAAWVLHS
jgi:2-polyprenyl-6-methoxyphenol hydroxylase-like FAD-dependent oxidoreductase